MGSFATDMMEKMLLITTAIIVVSPIDEVQKSSAHTQHKLMLRLSKVIRHARLMQAGS